MTRKMQSRLTKSIRLSKNVVPRTYHIELKPDLENFTFAGVETIELLIFKKTKTLTLHSKQIEINTADVLMGKEEIQKKIFATKIAYNENAQTVTFFFPKFINPGKVKLTIVFKGILNDKMRGFYRSRHSIKGRDYRIAATQFEATDARRAFPCFDEPAQKAIFHVSLIVPNSKRAISNTLPVSIKEHETGYKLVKFAPTPKMSTYLLAFIVGDFEYLESKSKSGVLVRVYTIPQKKHQAKFALEVTVKVLEFYEKYFDIPYPLNTLDMIALPDFSSYAMENWGAITFREVALLLDEKHSSTQSKERVVEVIAHEMAHQWFGNLVTMEWWTHLWLNEGFASYIPYLVTDKLFPKWNIWQRFNTETEGVALKLDALSTTHPIEVEVHHPDDIGEIFDTVSYRKGASIIRMLAEYLGEKDFRDGLRYYLKKHSYKNTETIHLWQAFEKISKKPVGKIMHNWTSKPGYPVIKASIKNNQLVLSQSRFFSSSISKSKSQKKNTLWQVPITLGNNKSNKKIFLSNTKLTLPLPKSWTKINLGETEFYRSAYDKTLLEKLTEPVQKKKLSSVDRLGIIRDLFALSEAGIVPTTVALEFLASYKNEDDYTVWLEIALGLSQLEQLMAKTSEIDYLNRLIIDLFSPVMIRLGWQKKKNEPYTATFLRSLVIYRLGISGDKNVVVEAKKKFELIERGKYVHPDIRGAVYSIIAKRGVIKEYNSLIELYKKENLHEEKNRLGTAFGNFSDLAILKKVCDFSMSPHVRNQDTISMLGGVGANPLGRDIWWSFIQKNWKTLVSRYGEGGLNLSRAITAISYSAETKHLESFKKFFRAHDAPGAKRAVEQVIERLENNVTWLARDQKAIEKFLATKTF